MKISKLDTYPRGGALRCMPVSVFEGMGGGVSSPQEQPFDPEAAVSAALLDMTQEIARPNYRLRIGRVGVIPEGSIVVVTGGAKQGKSQWCNIMAATMLKGQKFGIIERETPPFTMCYFDTEQTPFDVQTNMKRLLNAAGIEPSKAASNGFFPFMLRPYTAEQRKLIIDKTLELYKPDIVFIDGIRDLLHDFNDIKEVDALITWLLQTTTKMSNANFFVVIHTNEGSEKMRGHLGSELYNKCGDRFDVTKQGGHFKVKHICKHMAMLEPFLFHINEDGHLQPYEETK